MKNLIAALILSVSSLEAYADSNGAYFLFGAILGSHFPVAPQVYVGPPQIVYGPPVVVVPHQPYYRHQEPSRAYCEPYRGHQYAQCINGLYSQPQPYYGYPR